MHAAQNKKQHHQASRLAAEDNHVPGLWPETGVTLQYVHISVVMNPYGCLAFEIQYLYDFGYSHHVLRGTTSLEAYITTCP